MIPLQLSKGFLRVTRNVYSRPLPRKNLYYTPLLTRQLHTTPAWFKDSKDSKSPPDGEDSESSKDAKSPKKPSSVKPDAKANTDSDATDANKSSKIDVSDDRSSWKPKTDSSKSKTKSKSDPESVEQKRQILVNNRRRQNSKADMFNPRDFDRQEGNAPPISKNDRLLPIQLPFRPVYPGASTFMVSGDAQLMNVLRKLNDTPGWDHRVMAVLSKTPIQTAQLVNNIDDVHEIGCVCLLDSISINKVPETDRFSTYAAVFPMFRARVGELVENVKAQVETTPAPQTQPEEVESWEQSETAASERALDQVTVQYMKNISALPNEPYAVADDNIQRLCVRVIDALREISANSSGAKRLIDEFSTLVPQSPGGVFPQPDFLADFTASILPKNDTLQQILSETNVLERLKLVAELASKEVMYLHVQEGIARYGHNQTELRNREMILNEYLRYIKKELGIDGDDKSKSADKFLDKVAKVNMPKDVRRVFDDELNKFRTLEPTSGEYNTVRSYLDWLSSIPWGQYSTDRFDLPEARRLLDNSHYGMKDVKDRILELLAVGKLNGSVDGKIVCLSGPPGVGKTSIAKSVAESLNRKFDRFSVGGLHDASEIKGHRRTYVAAMPGRIIQALKRTQTQNPVILIDEIDKLGHGGTHGSPSAALLEVLDPEQNKNFQDTYLEVPVDLSRVLFLCTANYLESIPAPLMDRMEIINVPGYLPEEKVEIAAAHLAPKHQREAGLSAAQVNIDKEALDWLVRKYTREAGVRGLGKNIEKIFRKVAVNLLTDAENSKTLDSSNAKPSADAKVDGEAKASENSETEEPLHEKVGRFQLDIRRDALAKYVGPPVHNSDRMFDVLPVGVSMGLGWTPSGGMPLFIESVLQEPLSPKSKPNFAKTGQLGEVMGESVSIAYSFARMFMARNFPRNRFLYHANIHTHFPEGSIKKDGPSAGITTATSLLSLAMNKPMHNDVAMTGELSLTGKVLQIGGLREKSVAAKTAGAKTIVFPDDNRAEWADLPEQVKEGLTPIPVKDYHEVFDAVFGKVDAAQVNAAWPELNVKDEDKDRNVQTQVPV